MPYLCAPESLERRARKGGRKLRLRHGERGLIVLTGINDNSQGLAPLAIVVPLGVVHREGVGFLCGWTAPSDSVPIGVPYVAVSDC